MSLVEQALDYARTLIRAAPSGVRWGLCLTDDDHRGAPGTLTFYVPDEATRVAVRQALHLGRPTDEADEYETHSAASLNVSIVEGS